MVSNNKIKIFQSLKQGKYRDKHLLFVVEGQKIITELLAMGLNNPYPFEAILVSDSLDKSSDFDASLFEQNQPGIEIVPFSTIKKISSRQSPDHILAILRKPEAETDMQAAREKPCIILDRIQDPGNLGTIIRTSLWFGISTLYCSLDSADLYNPKVIQSTMGAFAHVQLYYTDLHTLLAYFQSHNKAIYGTCMQGHSLYDVHLASNAAFVFGNEGQGIHTDYYPYFSGMLSIPACGSGNSPESLNISIAHGIVCSTYRQQQNSYSK